MTRQQAEWASQHDWFVKMEKFYDVWFVTVREVLLMPSGEYAEQELKFKYLLELRAWAGY